MTYFRIPLAPLAGLLAATATLTACTTPARVSSVEVTRFVAEAPAELGSGTISVQAAPGIDPASLEYRLFAADVAEELAAHGYTVVDTGGDQQAFVSLQQSVDQPERRGPVSVGAGMGAGSYGSGVGLGIGIDLSGGPQEEIHTLLSVSIRPASGGDNLWEGRASFSATVNHPLADPAAASDRATSALFSDFPGTSGETIVVE